MGLENRELSVVVKIGEPGEETGGENMKLLVELCLSISSDDPWEVTAEFPDGRIRCGTFETWNEAFEGLVAELRRGYK
mgnify:FL=1